MKTILSLLLLFAVAGGNARLFSQDLGLVSKVLNCLDQEKPDLGLFPEQNRTDLELRGIRYVGQASTGSGTRHIFVVQFLNKAQGPAPASFERVLWFDEAMKFDFAISIGCGASRVELGDQKSKPALMLGDREYDLSGRDWKEPLILQQSFC